MWTDRCAHFESGEENARVALRELAFADRASECLACPESCRDSFLEGKIHEPRSLVHHAERAVVEPCLDILAGLALVCRLEVVDRPRAIECDRRNDSAPQHVHDQWIEAAFDRMRSHHEDHRALVAHGGGDSVHDMPEILRGENVRQIVHEIGERTPRFVDFGEGVGRDFVRPFTEGVGLDAREIERWKLHVREGDCGSNRGGCQ